MGTENCISDGAYEEAARKQADAITSQATIDVAIQVALALWQRNSSASISNMQKEIANRNMRMAEDIQKHAEKFWPEEKRLVDDAFSESKAVPQYDGTALAWANIVQKSLDDGRQEWLQTMREWCLAPTRCEDSRWRRNAQQARANLMSFADRQEENRAQALKDRRYSRQYAVLSLNHGRLGTAQTYSDLAGVVGANAGMALNKTINSGLTALGYFTYRPPPTGWSARIRENWARAPMPESQGPQAFPVVVNQAPIEPIAPRTTDEERCGPVPAHDASVEEWRRYYDCMGYK